MSTPLRALILEDRAADAELMLHELRRTGYDPGWVRVETEQDFLAHLDPALDIILADYHQPQFDALRALHLLQESGLDIPIIVITGVLGDELAVELIKRGAADFLLKDRLGRLGQAVGKALEQKKLREESKWAEEERARLLLETERNLQHTRTLYEIGLATTSTLDLQAVLNFLLEKIDILLPRSTATTVRLLNKETGQLELVACRQIGEEEWRLAVEQKRGGLSATVLKNKAPLIIDNVQTDSRVRDPEFFREHGLASYLGVPLIAKDEVLGVLCFFTKEEYPFSDEEVKFLSMLAGQLALSIHNSQLYEQTKNQAIELDKANKVKTEFLTIMSHEFRTPLGVIMQYTGMLQDGMLGKNNPKQQRASEQIMNQSKELLSMVNSILDATRIEAGGVKVERQAVNLGTFLKEFRMAYDVPLHKDLTLEWNYPSDLPVIQTDEGKLRNILQNLINNAIKFTVQGSVTLSAQYFPKTKTAEFQVKDTGVGIPKEVLPIIFDKFRQLDSSLTRSHGGVGLGLFIVKKITELLGGKVEVDSEPGKGSTFSITLPTGETTSLTH